VAELGEASAPRPAIVLHGRRKAIRVAVMTARSLAKAVLLPDWTVAGALIGSNPAEVAEAITGYEASLIPLCQADPSLADPKKRSRAAEAVRTALRPTGAKLAPHLSPAQASAWVDAVLLSLAKWPPAVALAAARAAVHEPFRFIGDVDAKLHELAAAVDERHRLALFRLRKMREEIERAANPPQPQITAPEEAAITNEEIRSWLPGTRLLGITMGFISRAQVEQVEAEERAAQVAEEER
jgi:hypothetical protein